MSAASLTALIARCRVLCQRQTHISDAELLRRFGQQRDAAAFEELLERYAPLVWGVCRRILPAESDCEDAFQATFLALVRRPDAIAPGQSLGAWLHTVAVRVARKAQVRARRQRPQAVLPEPTTSGDVADDVSSREMLRIVDEEIERLPDALRAPLILCCLQGRTRDEAAEALGCSVGTVKGRLERGRELLRRRLQRRGVQLPFAFLALTLASARIRAALWAKTMQTALYTPAPVVVGLAEAAFPLLTAGKCKVTLVFLLMATMALGVAGTLRTAKPAEQTPRDTPSQAKATAPKKPESPQIRMDRHGDPLPDGAITRLGTVRWRHGDFVHALAYSPDGKRIVTTGVGRALVLWDAATGKELRVFPSRGQPRSVAFSPDGKLIATTQRTGQLWDVDTGKMLRELKNVQSAVIALAFAPDGKTLATSNSDGSLHLWDTTNGDEKHRIECGQGILMVVAFAPDGKLLASGGNDGTIRFRDAVTGKEVRRITVAKKQIWSIVFSSDGKRLASGIQDDSPRLWQVATGLEVRTFGDKQGLFAPLAFSWDGKLLASGYPDGTLRLWDAASGEEKRHWHAGAGIARGLTFSPDGKTLASTVLWDGGIRLWDAATGRERNAIEGHHGPIPLLRFAADKATLISAGFDRNLLWWDLATRTPRRRFAWTTNSFSAIALSPDGNTVAVGDNKTHEVWLWDVRAGKARKLPGKHQNRILTIAFSPDGRLAASGGRDDAIHVWDVRQDKEVRQIKGVIKDVSCLCFSPDSTALAFGMGPVGNAKGEPTLLLRDLASGKERCSFVVHVPLSTLSFSPDGTLLASGDGYMGARGEPMVRLWDTTTGKELCLHGGHRSGIGALAFSRDGKLAVSGGGDDKDNSIHVWEAATGRLIRRFEGHHSWVWAVTFASDGLTVASSAGDSTILLWDITGRQQDGKLRRAVLTPRKLDACWTALAGKDTAKAYEAVWRLVAAPKQAVPFLRKHLRPVPRPDAKIVARLIADLNSDDFAVRQKATEELGKLGDATAPALRHALAGKPSLEMRRRIQQLLDQTRDWTAERLRDHRGIQALEHLGTLQAKEVLEALAAGAPGASRTEAAKAALRRLRR
ncbi:MAG: sigma-70 family RNA polymerase sigma factor [Gemmataceae bacterium]